MLGAGANAPHGTQARGARGAAHAPGNGLPVAGGRRGPSGRAALCGKRRRTLPARGGRTLDLVGSLSHFALPHCSTRSALSSQLEVTAMGERLTGETSPLRSKHHDEPYGLVSPVDFQLSLTAPISYHSPHELSDCIGFGTGDCRFSTLC